MKTIQELLPPVLTSQDTLREMKSKGKKIIGYVPNGYLPVEMVYACDAVPFALARGGESAPVAASSRCLARFLDPFCRAQIGYRLLGKEPVYNLLDTLVVPMTDNHVRAIADSWNFYTDVEVFRFGVPHIKAGHGYEYYLESLRLLKKYLEEFTGIEITDARLREEIEITNKIKVLLKEIGSLRKSDPAPLSGKEFIALNHHTLFADRHEMAAALQSILEMLKTADISTHKGPRVVLAGSAMALGDSKIIDLLEEAGASIVNEEFSEGVMPYRQTVAPGNDLLKALTDCYFFNRLPDAFFRGAAPERGEFLTNMVKEYNADGIVWYTMMYRDSYDVEGYILHGMFDNLGIPMLMLSSDYDEAETGGFRTRVETLVSTIGKG